MEEVTHQSASISTHHEEPSSTPVLIVRLSVGGMTCVSCVRAITDALLENEGISDVSVNLLGHSASLVVARSELVNKAVESICDAGYECEIISVSPKVDRNHVNGKSMQRSRTVDIEVSGMSDLQCAQDIMKGLKQLSEEVEVLKALERLPNDILRVKYIPSPPHFTIRTILETIYSSSPSPVAVSIAHPPSLEDAARRMHMKEQRGFFLRLSVAVLAAIPTLIIGIIYMSLVSRDDPVRKYFDERIWAGNVSRGEWALLFLATPVMFYSASVFHTRALTELWALWRPGSRVPLSTRFLRFGSMNLLISLGVSVAYFSSVAQLAISSRRNSDSGMNAPAGDTTYFDSVVFLTLFLVIGKYIESLSKRNAASAINSLTKLQSSEALLVISDSEPSSTAPSQIVQSGSLENALSPNSAPSVVEKIPTELLEVGDIVRLPQGGTPPADGTIVSIDSTQFDESSLTGESRTVKKGRGDQVFVGTINKLRAVDVRVDAIGGETMLEKIIEVVRQGQTKRAPIERLADVITSYFVPVVTALAIITWLVWLSLGLSDVLASSQLANTPGGWPAWSLEFAIAVFIIACPCGIGLAAPTAVLVGSGLAAKHGILVRGGGEAFQDASKIDVMVFDKTGTLTEGTHPKVTDVVLACEANLMKDDQRQMIAATVMQLASASSHPLCLALRRHFESMAETGYVVEGAEAEEIPGRGMTGVFSFGGSENHDARSIKAIMGNESFLREHGAVPTANEFAALQRMKLEGKSIVLLAMMQSSSRASPLPTTPATAEPQLQERFCMSAVFAIADAIRAEAPSVVSQLRAQGVETWMISGDNAVTAGAVAKLVGIPEENVIAGVLPHQKAEKVQWLQNLSAVHDIRQKGGMKNAAKRRVVAMVGDGINDAPALTVADIGIAIGSGSDVALSSAEFVLLSSNLRSLLTLIDLSKTVFRRIKFNFMWAGIYNFIALPVAAGVIYPAGQARLDPVWSSLAMALSSISVVCSSLMLRLYKPPACVPIDSLPPRVNEKELEV